MEKCNFVGMNHFYLILLMAVCIFGRAMSPQQPREVVSYQYEYRACMMHPLVTYLVEKDEKGTQRLIWSKLDGVKHVVVLEEDVLGRIGQIARESRLSRLKENYYPHMDIRDGYSWTLRIRYPGGSIYSDGMNAYPRQKQRDGIKAINDYLESFLPESK